MRAHACKAANFIQNFFGWFRRLDYLVQVHHTFSIPLMHLSSPPHCLGLCGFQSNARIIVRQLICVSSLTHSLTHSLARSLSLAHSLTHSLTNSPTFSITHSFTHSLADLLTHSLAHCATQK